MNIVRELRIKKGIQQKELALELDVSSAAVSNWEKGKSDPSGDRLKKLAEIFDTEPNVILGREVPDVGNLYVPDDPAVCGKSETDQIVERLLEKLDSQPQTAEARILAKGVDRLPKEQREQALTVFRAVFANHADYFEKGTDSDDT